MKQLHYKPAFPERVKPAPWRWVLIKLRLSEYEYQYRADLGYVLMQTVEGHMAQIPRYRWEQNLAYKGFAKKTNISSNRT